MWLPLRTSIRLSQNLNFTSWLYMDIIVYVVIVTLTTGPIVNGRVNDTFPFSFVLGGN